VQCLDRRGPARRRRLQAAGIASFAGHHSWLFVLVERQCPGKRRFARLGRPYLSLPSRHACLQTPIPPPPDASTPASTCGRPSVRLNPGRHPQPPWHDEPNSTESPRPRSLVPGVQPRAAAAAEARSAEEGGGDGAPGGAVALTASVDADGRGGVGGTAAGLRLGREEGQPGPGALLAGLEAAFGCL
jgi:hypothetical protein